MNNSLYSQERNNISNTNTQSKDSTNNVYGFDPLLYNGKVYSYYYPKSVKGDQYLSGSEYLKGEATIRGVKYKDLDLNLDVFKQELLLRYLNSNNVHRVIMISKAWLEDFTIGNSRFVLHSFPNTPERFYQVLGNDSIQLYYYWKKELKLDNSPGSSTFNFLVVKEQYVLLNGALQQFTNNRRFVKLFEKEKQIKIKKYIRHNRIKVTKAQDVVMEELINYCNK
jgi:hypothetical protein